MTRDAKNHQAYMDVLDENGPTMEYDEEYMECYRNWYPLGPEYSRDQWYGDDFD